MLMLISDNQRQHFCHFSCSDLNHIVLPLYLEKNEVFAGILDWKIPYFCTTSKGFLSPNRLSVKAPHEPGLLPVCLV